MFDLNKYLDALIGECQRTFGPRLLYVGLQGSFMRGEAKEDSDIDITLVLDRLSVSDMDAYRAILERIGYKDKSCGFFCGRDDLLHWNPLEVCQLLHTTKDLYGKLSDYLPEATRQNEIDYVKLSLGNLYHALCHRYIHAGRETSERKLRACGKDLFFLIQNLHFLESGSFVRTKRELSERVGERDRAMLNLSDLPDGYDFDSMFDAVIRWCQDAFVRIDRL